MIEIREKGNKSSLCSLILKGSEHMSLNENKNVQYPDESYWVLISH